MHLSPAAYCACFLESVEAMVGARGGTAYLPALIPLFGDGAFDDGGVRLAAYLATGSATAGAFQGGWRAMQEEVDGGGVAGPLDLSAAQAGRDGVARMQRALTQQREQVAQRRLHQDILALPVDDRVRQAFLSADRFSTQLIYCVPTPSRRASDAEFREMFCTYMGLPSPCLQRHVGDRIPCGHGDRICDAYGRHLDSATLPGGTWDDQHDDVAEVVLSRVLGAGVPGRREPRDIFAGVLPVASLRRRDGLAGSGIIPDGLLRGVPYPEDRRAPRLARARRRPLDAETLGDFKMLHLGVAQYIATREAQEQRAAAVAIRARAVDTDYQLMARERDQRHHQVRAADVAAGRTAPGPVLSLLRSYGVVHGWVFGAYAEASPDVHALLAHTVSLEARRAWEEMGARGYQEAMARLTASMYADWGMAAARAAARMRLARVRFIGLTRAQMQMMAGVGGLGPRPAAAAEAVGDYALRRMQGAFLRPAGVDALAGFGA